VSEAPELGQLDDIRAIHVRAVLAVLLRPVERVVREPDQLPAVRGLAREGGDARADRDRPDVVDLERAHPADDRFRGPDPAALVVVGQQERELVAAQPEGLAVLAQVRCDLGEDVVPGRVAVQVVDALEVVHVDEAEAEVAPALVRVEQLTLEPLVEVTVVAEPRERVGQGEPHGPQRAVGRALVEGDREQWAEESDREERRALPEHDEDERGRGHQREDDDRPAQARLDQLEERPPGRMGDDERDQKEVDRVLGGGGDRDLRDQGVGTRAADQADDVACDERGEGEHRGVVGDANERPVLEQLDQGRRRKGDEDACSPTEEDDRAGREDERERDSAGVRAFDRNRVMAGEGRRGEKRDDADEHRSGVCLGRERDDRGNDRRGAEQANGRDDRQQALHPAPPFLRLADYHSQLSTISSPK
jgi:hypothetical protein